MSVDVVPKPAAPGIAAGDCEFCCEFSGDERARFNRDYRDFLPSRVVADQGDFVAIPTVGQLLRGSLLILPRRHFDTCAQAQASLGAADLVGLVERACDALRRFGRPLVFEHGARPHTGGACGVYHAHLHVVPVPDAVPLGDLLPRRASTARSLVEALAANESKDEYLLARDTAGLVGHLELSSRDRDDFPSQYLRRFLVRRFALDRPWDWRQAPVPEADLLWTIENTAGM
jgi:diadenosine tetraphosphate (Ap4A) HIT family hydrolase